MMIIWSQDNDDDEVIKRSIDAFEQIDINNYGVGDLGLSFQI